MQFGKNIHIICNHTSSQHNTVFINVWLCCCIVIKNVVLLAGSVIAFIVYTSCTGAYKIRKSLVV